MPKKQKPTNRSGSACQQNASLYAYGTQVIRNSLQNDAKDKRKKKEKYDIRQSISFRGPVPPWVRRRLRRPLTPCLSGAHTRRSAFGDVNSTRIVRGKKVDRCGNCIKADVTRPHSRRRPSSGRSSVARSSSIWTAPNALSSSHSAWRSTTAASSRAQMPPRRLSDVTDRNRHLMYGHFDPRPPPFPIRSRRYKNKYHQSYDSSPVLSRLASPRSVYASLYSQESRTKRRDSCLKASMAHLSRTIPLHVDIRPQPEKRTAPMRQIRRMLVDDLTKTAKRRSLY